VSSRAARRDPWRRALAHALGDFADENRFRVIAEGIEDRVTRWMFFCASGIRLGQGFHLARPAPLADMRADLGTALDVSSAPW